MMHPCLADIEAMEGSVMISKRLGEVAVTEDNLGGEVTSGLITQLASEMKQVEDHLGASGDGPRWQAITIRSDPEWDVARASAIYHIYE